MMVDKLKLLILAPILACMPACSNSGASGSDGGLGASATPDGGTPALLKFGVFGDSRPPGKDLPASAFPSGVLTNIIKGLSSKDVQFMVGTGDWMDCTETNAACVTGDLDAMQAAEAAGGFKGTIYNTMGNHECHTQDQFECPNENETENVRQYKQKVLAPLGFEHSWFDFTVPTAHGDAHFIITSPSAWSPTNGQQGFLNHAVTQQAAYTFYFQHQPGEDLINPNGNPTAASPGAKPLYDAMKAGNPDTTLFAYGHWHGYFRFPGTNEVIIGNGGAPLEPIPASGDFFGYAVVEQLPNGNIQVTVYEATGTANDPVKDQWTLTPQGKPVN